MHHAVERGGGGCDKKLLNISVEKFVSFPCLVDYKISILSVGHVTTVFTSRCRQLASPGEDHCV